MSKHSIDSDFLADSGSPVLIQELSDSGVLRLTLNDAKRRNALSEAMLAELQSTLDTAAIDKAIRVIVVAANGPAFCAGHDLKEMTAARAHEDNGRQYYSEVMATCSTLMQSIVNLPKPVIAEVTGVATAAGCQLVASCDLAYAADNASFCTPGVHIGLFCSTPMVALSRNVTHKQAMEMLLTGDMTDAARAVEIGLVNRVVAVQDLTAVTMDVATRVAGKSSMTLATGKQAFYAQREMNLAEAYKYASNTMVENMLALDAEEGIQAFIEKREANWKDC